MLHCNTLCISNHLFLQFGVSSDAVTQGKAEDFTPSAAEFVAAFEGGILGNEQDMGAGLGPQQGGGVMEQGGAGSREELRAGGAGDRREGNQDIAAKEGFGCPKRGR